MLTWLKTEAADPDNELSRSLNLIPYSTVTLQRTQRRRPVLFSPNALAKTIIQKILNMGGAMDFDICKPGQRMMEISRPTAKYTVLSRDIFDLHDVSSAFTHCESKIGKITSSLRGSRREREAAFGIQVRYCAALCCKC